MTDQNTGDGPKGKRVDGRGARGAATRSRILEATERIVRRDGVVHVTLERVAEEAGISKGGLLYHFASKQALVNALLLHTLERTDQRLKELTEGSEAGAFASAYLDYVRTSEHARNGAAAGIFAAAALDEGELAPAKAQFAIWQNRLLEEDGLRPETALLVRIVGDGLWLIDLFDLAPPSARERTHLLDSMQAIIDADVASD